MLAMLQYIINPICRQVFTLDDVEEARASPTLISPVIPDFQPRRFQVSLCETGGRLPLRIRAVKEAPSSRLTTRSSQSKTPTRVLLAHQLAETLLVQVWYPITRTLFVRSSSHWQALVRTGDPSLLPFKLTTSDSAASLPRNPPPSAAPRIC